MRVVVGIAGVTCTIPEQEAEGVGEKSHFAGRVMCG